MLENIFSYLKWRGDLTLTEDAFNEVDNLILCALTYIELENFLKIDDSITIKELYKKYNQNNSKENLFDKNQNLLFKILSESKRFQNVVVTRFVNEVEKIQEKQFSALTYILPNDFLFIAFRGTDSTVVGWKENFNMSYMESVPAQERAKEYLEDILMHTKKYCFVGGHSKGGNLAMYAAIFCNPKLKNKILKVYNNDGPGFNNKLLEEEASQELKEKIITYIPKASVIGNMFDNYTKTVLIESAQLGVLQHDLYSWVILGNHFVYAKEMDEKTKELANFLNQTLDKIPDKQKEKIFKFLYDLFTSLHVYNLEDTLLNIFNNQPLLKKYQLNLDDMEWLWKVVPIVVQILKSL